MASKLLVLGARPLGITPGGGCLALFITLLQLATMVRIVSDSSWDTLLQERSRMRRRLESEMLAKFVLLNKEFDSSLSMVSLRWSKQNQNKR